MLLLVVPITNKIFCLHLEYPFVEFLYNHEFWAVLVNSALPDNIGFTNSSF